MALFDLNSLGKRPEASTAQQPPDSYRDQAADKQLGVKFLAEHYKKIDSLKNLGGLPQKGEIFFLFTLNSFNAFTFIPYIISQSGQIQELIISTYSINQRILQAFIKLMDSGQLLRVHILISDSIKFRVPKVADQLQHLTQIYPGRLTVHFAWNHSKITLLKTANAHYVAEGSGNWSENAANEQYILLNNEQVFNFRKSCIESLG